ncbi:MAG: hypothetical protein JO105_00715 [Hyphomicrobiales bacterium]|nr:hypothetical protein [Hyphomicrobiales bacterium]
MARRNFTKWVRFALDTNLLAFEAQQVVALRMMKLALGDAKSSKEAYRMVREKASAAGEAGLKIATGASGHSIVKHYRRKVRANRRRLSK